MITELEIRKAFVNLGSVYNLPDDVDTAVRTWRRVLAELDPVELDGAIVQYLKSESRYFPKPGQIKALASVHRLEHGHVVQSAPRWREGDGEPCPGCDATIRHLEPSEQVLIDWTIDKDGKSVLMDRLKEAADGALKRFGVLHDLDEHDRRKVPCWGSYGFRRASIATG